MGNTNLVLVLGATGGIGGEVARQLKDGGWNVRGLQRRGEQPIEKRSGITWFRGDALNAQDVMTAANGCSVIVHAVNPPGYRRWSELVLPMLDNSIAAATALRATLVLPGTVYNFGPDAFPVLTEDSPQYPVTRKGAIRVEMERRLLAASKSGARVLIVRAGDFFGPQAGNNWFSQGLIKPGKSVRTVSNPGLKGVGHQWAYLPDIARTMVEGFLLAVIRSNRFCPVPHGGSLGCGRLADVRIDSAGGVRTDWPNAAGQRLPLVVALIGITLRNDLSRDARNALPLA